MLGTQNRLAWPAVSSDFWRDMQASNGGADSVTWRPAAVVTESDSGFVLRLAVPGVLPDSIEVGLDGDFLDVTGDRPAPTQDEGSKVVLSEMKWGRFHRRFRLGSEADRDAIEATHRDGLLEIVVPKHQEARPRRIPVSTQA